MNALLEPRVGKNKTPPDDSGAERRSGKPKYDAAVKFTKDFKEQLEAVASEMGLYPGEMVERHMGDWVATKYMEALEVRLQRAKREAKDRKGSA